MATLSSGLYAHEHKISVNNLALLPDMPVKAESFAVVTKLP